MEREMTAMQMEDPKPQDSIHDWGAFASTTDALTTTLLVEVPRRASMNSVPGPVSVILEGVSAAELDHWNFIQTIFRPSTERFWIPDGFFGGPDDPCRLRRRARRGRGRASCAWTISRRR